jgi:hypothetical protein
MAKTIHNYTQTLHGDVQTQGAEEVLGGWAEAFGDDQQPSNEALTWEDCYALTEDEELMLEGLPLKEKIVEIFLTDNEEEEQ